MTLPTRQGDALVVPIDARLPKVCLKCGRRDDLTRRERSYSVGGLGQGAGAAGAAVGVVIAQTMRDVDHVVAVAVFGAIVVVVAFVAWWMDRSATKVKLALPLCATCDAAWTEGERLRIQVVAGLGVAFAILAAGYALSSSTILVTGGIAFGVALVVAIAARLPTRFVNATAVSQSAVRLKVDAAIADEVVTRAKRLAEKREARALEAD